MSYQLIDIVQRFGQPRILVLGDLILDRYVWGEADRISQEAPVILLREEQQESRLGGAANVANMVRGLDADVSLCAVVGNDDAGRQAMQELSLAGVDCKSLIVDETRPTTVKQRFIGRSQARHPHQILRVDREVTTPLAAEVESKLLASILPRLVEHNAVLISDYAKGVCTPRVAKELIAACAKRGIPCLVDPPSHGKWDHYRGATAVTPNRLETSRATGRPVRTEADALAAGRQLCETYALDHAYVTLDSDGIALVRRDGSGERYATRKREVYDITGAGDMVLAMIGVGEAAGVEPADMARLANVAGGLEVEQIGVVRITRDEILADLIHGGRTSNDKVNDVDTLARQLTARRRIGQTVVLTNGCFDVMHAGHVSYLQEAAKLGDCLVVALNSDASVRSLDKGTDRPIIGEAHRATMLAALEAVDYVLIFDESTPHALLHRLKPDVLVKGGTYSVDEIVGKEVVEGYGGEVRALGVIPGLSTTRILEQIRGQRAA